MTVRIGCYGNYPQCEKSPLVSYVKLANRMELDRESNRSDDINLLERVRTSPSDIVWLHHQTMWNRCHMIYQRLLFFSLWLNKRDAFVGIVQDKPIPPGVMQRSGDFFYTSRNSFGYLFQAAQMKHERFAPLHLGFAV